jgi:hypothetical protein
LYANEIAPQVVVSSFHMVDEITILSTLHLSTSATTAGAMKILSALYNKLSPKSVFSRPKNSGLVILPCCLPGLNKMHPQPDIEVKRVKQHLLTK